MAKSKYSRLSSMEVKRVVERAIAIKKYNPELDWAHIAASLGVTRASLRDMIKKHKETQIKEGSNNNANAATNVERAT